MAKNIDKILADLPAKRRTAIKARAGELATLKDLRQAALGVGQKLTFNVGGHRHATYAAKRQPDVACPCGPTS
jgi:hypothetical protein